MRIYMHTPEARAKGAGRRGEMEGAAPAGSGLRLLPMSIPTVPSAPMSTPAVSLARPAGAVPTSNVSRLRVRYCECDPMGVAHHAAYVPWLEIGRTEILRDTGVTYADLEKHGVFLVVVKLEVRYRRPVRYDDLVEVRTRVTGGSRV